MKAYNVSVMLLYLAYGLIFLLSGDRLSVAHTGAWFTATGPAIQVWGAVFLLAAGCINWALIEPGRRLAQRVALGAMLFSGASWGVAGLAITLLYGLDPTRPIFWAWFTFVSFYVVTILAPQAGQAAGLPSAATATAHHGRGDGGEATTGDEAKGLHQTMGTIRQLHRQLATATQTLQATQRGNPPGQGGPDLRRTAAS